MQLRALERRLLILRSHGKTSNEIATMFKRSPAHIERVYKMIDIKLRRL